MKREHNLHFAVYRLVMDDEQPEVIGFNSG